MYFLRVLWGRKRPLDRWENYVSKLDLLLGSQAHISLSAQCFHLDVAYASQTHYVRDISYCKGVFHWSGYIDLFFCSLFGQCFLSSLRLYIYPLFSLNYHYSTPTTPRPTLGHPFSTFMSSCRSCISVCVARIIQFTCQYHPPECKLCDGRQIYFTHYYVINNHLWRASVKSIIFVE